MDLRRPESVQHSYRRGGACRLKGGVLNPALRLLNVIGRDGGWMVLVEGRGILHASVFPPFFICAHQPLQT